MKVREIGKKRVFKTLSKRDQRLIAKIIALDGLENQMFDDKEYDFYFKTDKGSLHLKVEF